VILRAGTLAKPSCANTHGVQDLTRCSASSTKPPRSRSSRPSGVLRSATIRTRTPLTIRPSSASRDQLAYQILAIRKEGRVRQVRHAGESRRRRRGRVRFRRSGRPQHGRPLRRHSPGVRQSTPGEKIAVTSRRTSPSAWKRRRSAARRRSPTPRRSVRTMPGTGSEPGHARESCGVCADGGGSSTSKGFCRSPSKGPARAAAEREDRHTFHARRAVARGY